MNATDHKETSFKASATVSLGVLLLVVGAALIVPAESGAEPTLANWLVEKFNTTRFVTLTRGQAEAEMEGYYEGLFQSSQRAVSVSALVAGQWAAEWVKYEGEPLREDITNVRGDFLYYDHLPNLDVEENDGRLVTNSFGMADREYPLERTPGVRRVAYIGDSLVRGLGSTPGANFESLLEDHLGGLRSTGDSIGFESLNFGVGGHRLTQMVEMVRTKAAGFSPDVFVIVLTNISVARLWSYHIGQLVNEGIDLKYPYLLDIARRAGVRPNDDPVTMEAKLGPYRMDVTRGALESVRDFANENGSQVLVMLLPAVLPSEISRGWFVGVPEIVASLDLPMLDVLDAFEHIEDLEPYRIGPRNSHPTDLGHAVLFDRIVRELDARPEILAMLTG